MNFFIELSCKTAEYFLYAKLSLHLNFVCEIRYIVAQFLDLDPLALEISE
jgi:hypothetical protein